MNDEPENPPIFKWGHPSHIEAEWENRSDNEHLGLEVRAFDHPLQYKIDIWSEKADRGIYRMRLDGFGHLRWFAGESLRELADDLRLIESADVIADNRRMWGMMKQLDKLQPEAHVFVPPEIPESVITEYFEAARNRTLEELQPLLELC